MPTTEQIVRALAAADPAAFTAMEDPTCALCGCDPGDDEPDPTRHMARLPVAACGRVGGRAGRESPSGFCGRHAIEKIRRHDPYHLSRCPVPTLSPTHRAGGSDRHATPALDARTLEAVLIAVADRRDVASPSELALLRRGEHALEAQLAGLLRE